jgi:membrane-associated protease RseP (regulator of RpoE activity)
LKSQAFSPLASTVRLFLTTEYPLTSHIQSHRIEHNRIHNEDPNVQRLPELHGALVGRVAPNSPAAACGFRKNDIIVEVNGDDVSNSEDADVKLDKCRPGSVARVRVVRGEPSVSIELQANPLDLLTVMEERRLREAIMTGIKPPAQQQRRSFKK